MNCEVAFRLNGDTVALSEEQPTESLLRWLKRHGHNGTKEGCADGDCGACTVALVEADADGRQHYRAVNSCLLPMGAVAGRDIVTVEHLADGEQLHPVQRALVDCSGSQCGYCTPGFVMSLFAGYYAGELEDGTTEGNLCRCTGYAPIRRAAHALGAVGRIADRFSVALERRPALPQPAALGRYFNPSDIASAIELKQRHAGSRWIAGATDLGVELSRGRTDATTFISLEHIDALRRISVDDGAFTIGAGVNLSALERALSGRIPALDQMLRWFAARQVRNRATFGGNLGTASPIGDLLPLLLALDGRIELQGPNGRRVVAAEDFFRGYRQTLREDHELVVAVQLPRDAWRSAAYKVAKRPSDDISIVAAVFALGLDSEGQVEHARLAFGGVAAMPLRALATEAWLHGRRLDEQTIEHCARLLREEFTPLSDHRASASYRRELCASLFRQFVAEHAA